MEIPSAQMVIHAKSFNEVCEALNKVHQAQWTDWYLRIPAVLWAYRTMCKKLMEQAPPRLEYGVNTIISIEYKMPSLRIATPIGTTTREALEEGIPQLNKVKRLGPKEEI